MRLGFLALLGLCSCATISTAGLSDACKSAYNSCLNGCPDVPPPPTLPPVI